MKIGTQNQAFFPENILEATSMDLLIDFARIGLGCAGVIREFVLPDLENGTLRELSLPFSIPPREIGSIQKLNPPMAALRLMVRVKSLYLNLFCIPRRTSGS